MAITAKDVWPEHRLRESYAKHAVRTQLHRLFAMIDGDAPAPDIFDDPDTATSMLAAAHVTSLDACVIELLACDRARFLTADKTLRGEFHKDDAFLPRLRTLEATRGAKSPSVPASVHRTCAAVHYFIALVENPARNPIPFREILSPAFRLDYTATPMTDLAAVDRWVSGALSSVVASEHDIHFIDVHDLGDGSLTAEVRMTSQALFPDGSGAISRNTQRWTMANSPQKRFASVSEIQISRDAVEFFGPGPDFEPRERPKPH